MKGTMRTDATDPAGLEAALYQREAWLTRASGRWRTLAHGCVLAFVALVYSNPMYWWPWFEQFRLAFVTMVVGAGAVVMHRLTSGERIRFGGWRTALLFGYLAFVPLSLAWSYRPSSTLAATVDALKLAALYIVVQNALDTRTRLRRFMLVAALASLGPALGGIDRWLGGERLVEGFRTAWRGLYADPNRLAMSLVAVLPFALYGTFTAKRRWVKLVFAGVVAAQVTAIVLTHSRSGSVAAVVAAGLFLFRGMRGAKPWFAAATLAAGLAVFAPSSFWERSRTIADYEVDASVEGRRNAWKVLGAIVEERPLTGVGAGAFLHAWNRYAPLEAGGRRYVAHNILFEIVGDLGIIAFALFAGFGAWLLVATWNAGRDPLVGLEARAIFAALAGYFVTQMVNGYSLSWFIYFLFGCAAAAIRLSGLRRTLASEPARAAA